MSHCKHQSKNHLEQNQLQSHSSNELLPFKMTSIMMPNMMSLLCNKTSLYKFKEKTLLYQGNVALLLFT
jgi:hypothetical protein